MRTHLLDASVWLASSNDREHLHDAARRLLDHPASPSFAALDLTFYEVVNVALARWRSPDRARTLVELVRAACPGAIASIDDQLTERAIALADRHKLSLYDAAYVAAAQLNGWTLVSGDYADLVNPGLALSPDAALAAAG
jgi:predicted nucleic acid-binding protein